MIDLLPEHSDRFVRAIGPEPDEVLRAMDARADEEGFPHVGPAVGGWLQLLAASVGARRVFEFGSGFGYSAYWFARALPEDGEVVLTEVDADELELAREYFERGGLADRAAFEHGDAIETIEDYEGPFDVVLIDNEKDRYAEAFEAVRETVAPGGLVIADNAMAGGSIEFERLLRREVQRDAGDGGSGGSERGADGQLEGASPSTRGIAAYLDAVRDDPEFETGVLPLGEGISVSRRVE